LGWPYPRIPVLRYRFGHPSGVTIPVVRKADFRFSFFQGIIFLGVFIFHDNNEKGAKKTISAKMAFIQQEDVRSFSKWIFKANSTYTLHAM